MERVVLFIDGGNFYHALKDYLGSPAVNFYGLAKELCGNRRLVRIYYYNIAPEELSNGQLKFFENLNNTPYLQVVLGKVGKDGSVCHHCGKVSVSYVEKGVDVLLALDMMRFAVRDMYDTAILISRDGDFAPVAKEVKDLGKHVEVAFFPRKGSRDLLNVCDIFREIDREMVARSFHGSRRVDAVSGSEDTPVLVEGT